MLLNGNIVVTLFLQILVGIGFIAEHNNCSEKCAKKSRGMRTTFSILISLMFILASFATVSSAETGDFSIDFVAAAPESYNHLTGGGAYDDRTIGVDDDVVESLEGGDYNCGDIVTFFAVVNVDGNLNSPLDDDPQTIEMDFSFLMDTTGQSGVAIGDIVDVNVNYGTIEDLIAGENTTDDGIIDDGGSVATLVSETTTGPMFTAGSELHGTVKLTDLEAGEQVVVRIDTKLYCDPGSNPTGNLQGDLMDAELIYINDNTPVDPPGAIPGGAQTIPFKQIGSLGTPDIDIIKTVTTENGDFPGSDSLTVNAGATVKYLYTVENTGDAPLFDVSVVDDNGTSGDTNDDFVVTISPLTDEDGDGNTDDLAASATATGTALVTLNIADTLVNTATVTGYDSVIDPTALTDTDTATVTVVAAASYSIEKTITGADTAGDGVINNAGEIIEYQIVVTNDGGVDLTGVSVSDPLLEGTYGSLSSPTESLSSDGILEVGETWTYTGSYTVQQSDINDNGGGDGDIDNTATVSSDDLPDETDSAEQPLSLSASYSIEKTITGADTAGDGVINNAGEIIEYQIVVTNDGNADLSGVSVADPLLEGTYGSLSSPTESLSTDGILEVGETWTYTGSYTVQQSDINDNGGGDGDIDNTATVSSDDLPDETDSAEQPLSLSASYSIEKTITGADTAGDGVINNAGEIIDYQIVVTNDGNADLTGVSVADPLLEGTYGSLSSPTESLSSDGILEVGETWTYTGSYTVQQSDINDNGGGDGDIDNTATVSSDDLPDETDSAEQPLS
ncbi:MAG: hypothetical protein R2741_09765 [Methanolobus sp.]